jgi:hypothetical protein
VPATTDFLDDTSAERGASMLAPLPGCGILSITLTGGGAKLTAG